MIDISKMLLGIDINAQNSRGLEQDKSKDRCKARLVEMIKIIWEVRFYHSLPRADIPLNLSTASAMHWAT